MLALTFITQKLNGFDAIEILFVRPVPMLPKNLLHSSAIFYIKNEEFVVRFYKPLHFGGFIDSEFFSKSLFLF